MTSSLQPEDAPALSHVLARAFAADPYLVHVLPDDRRRAAVLPTVLGASVRYALRYGRVDVLSALRGAAVWLAPGATAVTVPRMARVGGLGSVLLRRGLARADADALPAWLRTENERNLSTYRRHGFETVDASSSPDGLRTWAMRRSPRAVPTAADGRRG